MNRLFEMVHILLNKNAVTAGELAQHFEVSTRTIYRDVETLSGAGIPIYALKGKGGGIRLMENYVLNKSMLTDGEQRNILVALQGLTAMQVPEAESVLKKMAVIFNKSSIEWIAVDFSHWGSEPKEREKFDIIKNAILSSKILSFDYVNYYDQKSQRAVEPQQILFKEKAWYLKGYCTQKADYRTFKIARMKQVIMTQEDFLPRLLQLAEEEGFAFMPLTVRLKIRPQAAHRVQEEFTEEQVERREDGSFLVTLVLPEDEWIYGFILSFGENCEVLEPPHVRAFIKRRLEKGAENYK